MKDWKTILGLFLAALGIAVTVWLFWYSDAKAHGLKLEVISTAAMGNVDTQDAAIRIFINGVEVKNPSVTTLRLSNDGLRPIAVSAFDGVVEIGVDNGTSIVRAQLADGTTPDLSPQISINSDRLRIQPLMLNPGDEIDLLLTTAGPVKHVVPHAHVAGVKGVTVSAETSMDATFVRLGLFASVLVLQWLVGSKAIFGDPRETRFYGSLSYGITSLLLLFVMMDAAAADQLVIVNFAITKVATVIICIAIALFWAWHAFRNIESKP